MTLSALLAVQGILNSHDGVILDSKHTIYAVNTVDGAIHIQIYLLTPVLIRDL